MVGEAAIPWRGVPAQDLQGRPAPIAARMSNGMDEAASLIVDGREWFLDDIEG